MTKYLFVNKRGDPVLPGPAHYADPTKMGGIRRRAIAAVRERFSLISKEAKKVLKERLEALKVEKLPSAPGVFTNANGYVFKYEQADLDEISAMFDEMYRSYLDVDGNFQDPGLWISQSIEPAYEKGASDILQSAKNMASAAIVGSAVSSKVRTMTLDVLFGDSQYRRRVELINSRVLNELKGLSQQAIADLSSTLTRGMANGLGVGEITDQIVDRIGVSERRAETIARTEINNAYRTATRQESTAINENLFADSDYEMQMLWFSALSPTTREWHASRHGKTYTQEEVNEFYSKDGNAINCLCSQTAVLVNKKTKEIVQEDLIQRMEKQKKEWKEAA